jgi:hypothetical protein
MDEMIHVIEWGMDEPALWAKDVGNSWRTAQDLQDDWLSTLNSIDIVILSYIFRSLNIVFMYSE